MATQTPFAIPTYVPSHCSYNIQQSTITSIKTLTRYNTSSNITKINEETESLNSLDSLQSSMTDVSNTNTRTLAGYEQQRFELKMKHVSQNNEKGCLNEKALSQKIQTKSARETTFSPSTTNVRQTKGTNSNSNFTNVIPHSNSLNNDNKCSNNYNSFVNAKKYGTPQHNINQKEIAKETRNLKQKRDRRKTLNSTLLNNLISATVKKAERLSHSARRNSGIGLDYIRQLSSKNTNLPNLSTNFTPERKASNFSRHLSTAQFSTKEAYANDLDLGFKGWGFEPSKNFEFDEKEVKSRIN